MSARNDVSGVILERSVPACIRRFDTSGRADCADIVTGTASRVQEMSPGEVLHLVLRPAAARTRALIAVARVIQYAVLGFRPPLRPSPDNLYGWRIAARGDTWLRLEAASSPVSRRRTQGTAS